MPRRVLLTAVVVVCALAGSFAAVRLAGPATYSTGLGDVRLEVGLGAGGARGLELYVPLADWGLRAPVTGAPVQVTAEPRRIDREGLVGIVGDTSGQRLALLREELSSAVRSAVLRAGLLALVGALAGGLLALLVWHVLGLRGRRLALAPAGALGTGLVLAVGLAAWTALTWDAERLERPRYYASGPELERLLDQAGQLRRTGERYSDRVDVAIRSIAGLLDDSGGRDSPANRILLASDVHNNLLTLPVLERYGGRPVFYTGDYTINGSEVESGFLRGLESVGSPTVAVSGNHDSVGLMRSLARRGMVVLTHEGRLGADGRVTGSPVQRVAGLLVAGFEDPLQYDGDFPSGIRAALSFKDFPDGSERFRRAVAEQWAWWQALPERPQVLLVHQEGIGRALAQLIWDADPEGPPLAILSGHTHRQRLVRAGPVTVVNSGSAGAGGVFGAGRDSVGLALLDFTSEGALEASDLVQMNPSTTAAGARRIITERPDCDDQLVICTDEPTPPTLPAD